MGKSERVIPPLPPIKVEGNTLSTVLREHALSGAGAWDQVTRSRQAPAEGADALGGAQRRDGEPSHGGRDERRGAQAGLRGDRGLRGGGADGAGAKRVGAGRDGEGVPDHSSPRRRFGCPRNAGPREDGPPLPGDPSGRRADALHARLRRRAAVQARREDPGGRGAGVGLDQANKTNIVGTFYPYVWLGGGERGLAWFADSDKGWSLDDTTPTVEVVRKAGVLTLRVSSSAAHAPGPVPARSSSAPGDPAPSPCPDPVNWRRWIGSDYEDVKVQPLSIVGATYCYGMLSFDLWPRGRDLSIYEAFSRARDTGQPDGAFVKQWLEGYKPYCDPQSDMWKTYDIHVPQRHGQRGEAAAVARAGCGRRTTPTRRGWASRRRSGRRSGTSGWASPTRSAARSAGWRTRSRPAEASRTRRWRRTRR